METFTGASWPTSATALRQGERSEEERVQWVRPPFCLTVVPVGIDSNGQLGAISSSRRYKEEIQDMGDASSGLLRVRPVTFRIRSGSPMGRSRCNTG